MAVPKSTRQLVFRGEIIEIVEQKREKLITVNLIPCSIDIPVRAHDEPHLGDLVSFEATIKVKNVERVVPTD